MPLLLLLLLLLLPLLCFALRFEIASAPPFLEPSPKSRSRFREY
jgi:hypothetical protein